MRLVARLSEPETTSTRSHKFFTTAPHLDCGATTVSPQSHLNFTGGAKTTPYATKIGTLEPGKAADMVLLAGNRLPSRIAITKCRCSMR
jgi:hypothetical protein